ncbi:C4-dicarboxylate transporter DcuC [Facklamia sp. DSM 111018]|uniref:C4-dicarboxylate transporter DcuC n=1 Tax=Facklamia lactis TaxID=2749967 RepID=A0ABS0LN29_9LACT|nr:C4-dicarboxylate transporter DcuC [Facklamia lactis]MBG9979750.1 C4-dicarboxylate transporter DcuC [Facklamia lactis]MBG9985570.1 C4-dicarboxylate transporter DcuC [Facklamia lactis]
MNDFIILSLTLFIVITCSYLVVKKYNPLLIFFMGGIIIHVIIYVTTGFSPMENESMGNIVFDIFGMITSEFKNQLGGVGSNLMIVAGYATLMTRIGASSKLAEAATKPLKKIDSPYLILALLYVIGIILKMMITSHAGLGLLLMATTFPILTNLGISKLSAASTIILSGSLDWGPNDGAVIFAADNVTGIEVGSYFINYQVIPAVLSIVAVAITVSVYFKYLDSKEKVNEKIGSSSAQNETFEHLPFIYAFLPALPLILVILVSMLPKMSLDVFSANLIGIVVTLVVQTIRYKKDIVALLTEDLKVVFNAMGESFANIVTLIVAASVFAKGLIQLGGFNIIANYISNLGGAQLIIIISFSLLSFLAVIILGSGNAGWFAFGPLVNDIAPKVGLETYQIAVPMQLASGMGRGLSPVAAAMISVAGLAEIELEEIVKRNFIPIIVGLVVNIISSYIIFVL